MKIWMMTVIALGTGNLLAEPLGYEGLKEKLAAHTFEEGGKSLPYRLLVPDEKVEGKLPVVLCMHGAGGRGSDNDMVLKDTVWALNTLASEAVQKNHPCFLVAPQCPNGAQWVDTPWGKGSYSVDAVPVSANMTLAVNLFKKLLEEHAGRIDTDRIYVVGFSMGGYATWDLIMRNPEMFAAAVPVCGSGDPTKADLVKGIPVWAFHGDKDGAVPVAGSREMVEAIKKAGGEPKYSELPGVGHNAWGPAWKNPELVEWLFAQKRE